MSDCSFAPDVFAQLANTRHSTRAFDASRPVPQALLRELLATARQAPSGANLQPGAFALVQGEARQSLSAALLAAQKSGLPANEDYGYFPRPMPMVLRKRQVAAAQALYGALGVGRDERGGREAQFARNFCFFDAPVALVVSIDARLGSGGYMDLGMCLYGLMLAAHAQGLASCAIGALASYPQLVRQQLGWGSERHIVCGMALGYADEQAPVNQTRTERMAVDDFFEVIG